MKLISNKSLRDFAATHGDAGEPLQNWRRLIERSSFSNFSDLRSTFVTVDKVGEKYVFNIGGNKYRLIATIAFVPEIVWVKGILTHRDYDKGDWK